MNLTEFEMEILQRLTVGVSTLAEISEHLRKIAHHLDELTECTEPWDENKPELGRVLVVSPAPDEPHVDGT